MTPDLLNMPEDVMTKIMEDIGLKAIMTLRKVCHDLRNFIDDVKPNVNLKEIWIDRTFNNSITLEYRLTGEIHSANYTNHAEGCLIRKSYGGVLLKNEDFFTVSTKDFEIVLGLQKSVLEKIALIRRFEDNESVIFLKNLQRILTSRVHPLKVETFAARCMDQNQIMSILPFLDSNTLSELDIFSMDSLEVDQLVKLDQWKNIKHMDLNGYVDFECIQHFTHLTIDYIHFKSTYFPDLVSLKNVFLHAAGFQFICIKITEKYSSDAVQRSTELLGEPYFDTEHRRKWFYRIATTNQILVIEVNSSILPISLTRINENMVPQDAVIQN